MEENREAVVHDDELVAIKDSMQRDMPLFAAHGDEGQVWIVAVSDHQAKLAMVDRIWPMAKYTKRARDSRYTSLLESALLERNSSKPDLRGRALENLVLTPSGAE